MKLGENKRSESTQNSQNYSLKVMAASCYGKGKGDHEKLLKGVSPMTEL